jgi:hypothetical protein
VIEVLPSKCKALSSNPSTEEDGGGQHHWLTPVILATWESEIRRIIIQGQYRQGGLKTPTPRSTAGHSGVFLSSQAIWEAKIGKIMIPGQPRQKSS